MTDSAHPDESTTSQVSAAAAWTRWAIEKSAVPGNEWHVRHDCGYAVVVDLGQNSHAITEAEHAHERECGR